MPTRDFIFALELSDETLFNDIPGEVAACMLDRLGVGEGRAREVVGLLNGALTRGVTEGSHRCEVAFHVHGDDLDISVTFVGGQVWQKTCPL